MTTVTDLLEKVVSPNIEAVYQNYILPSGYTRVEYLQSVSEADADGNVNWQYFSITEDGSNYTRIFVEAEDNQIYGPKLVFAAGPLSFLRNGDHWRCDWRQTLNYIRENVERMTADFYIKGDTKCIFNGTEYELIEGTGGLDWAGNPRPIENIRFMGYSYREPTWHKGIRLYKAEIYTAEGCIHQLLPCLDETGTPCMYDVITKTPYYNQGTGDFTYA